MLLLHYYLAESDHQRIQNHSTFVSQKSKFQLSNPEKYNSLGFACIGKYFGWLNLKCVWLDQAVDRAPSSTYDIQATSLLFRLHLNTKFWKCRS